MPGWNSQLSMTKGAAALGFGLGFGFLMTLSGLAEAQPLPPVPVPPQNPITEEKRVLGKILFWEKGLSSDSSVACGSCHSPAAGGTDDRPGLHPGADLVFGSDDDILGSEGVRRMDASGNYITDPVFGDAPRVTSRASQNFFGGLWSPLAFWDGRAEGEFRDPLTGDVLIPVGGSLENQAIGPLLNDVEMAHENRGWSQVTDPLIDAVPMALATDLPADMLDAIAIDPSYPELFESAFGDPEITPSRIAFAIATYERTLVPNQTPWDDFQAGNQQALTPPQLNGAQFVQTGPCGVCHGGPMFTNNSFRNIGLRPPAEDNGREGVTGNPVDRGRFKVPSLRNVGLRDRLMHTGHIEDVADAVEFYAMGPGHPHFTENQDPVVRGGIPMPQGLRRDIADFLNNGLTDPRVAAETFPFDRPTLLDENPADIDLPGSGSELATIPASAYPNPFRDRVSLEFQMNTNGPVEVGIYSASGQLIFQRRVEAVPGANILEWDGRDAHGGLTPSGVYFATFQSSEGRSTGRLVRID